MERPIILGWEKTTNKKGVEMAILPNNKLIDILKYIDYLNGLLHPSFWFMKDNHTFIKPKGNNLKEITVDLLKIAKNNPYGMVCPVIILQGEEEIRRVGEGCSVDENGVVELTAWLRKIKKDEIVKIFNQLTIKK